MTVIAGKHSRYEELKFPEGLTDNNEKVASSKKLHHTLFKTKLTKLDTLSMTKTVENPYALEQVQSYLYSPNKGVPLAQGEACSLEITGLYN